MDQIRDGLAPQTILWTFAKTFFIALVLTPILRDIFRAYHIVDRPGFRKVHAYPIPRLGGLAIATAYGIGLAGLNPGSGLAGKIVPGAAIIFLTGILDDFFNLPARVKFVLQISAAVLTFWIGLRIPGPWFLAFPATVFWLVLTTNSFNLVDGLDGLCAGMGLIGTLTLLLFAWMSGSVALQKAALPLVGPLLGFLCFNLSRATMFLGDSGALSIGFLAGCFGLLWASEPDAGGIGMAAPVLAVAMPLMEVSLSVARRFLQHRPLFAPDRGHMHHRLLDRGFTAPKSVFILYGWALIGSAFGAFLAYPAPQPLRLVALAGACSAIGVGIWQLKYPEFQVAGRLLIQGKIREALRGPEA